MSAESELSCERAQQVADDAVFASFGKHLTDNEMKVLVGAWNNLTYEQIAEKYDYATSTFQRDYGNKLWKKLSDALGEKVTKNNFKEALKRASRKSSQLTATELKYPEGPVPLNSSFYVERSPLEKRCYEEILQPGALIRIKAPKQMGKTSLLNRILDGADHQDYKIVRLNLREADREKFSNLDIFLRWFSTYISLQLKRPPQLDNYWHEAILGSLVSCKNYFDMYLLHEIDRPIVLGLDEVDRIFEYSDIFKFFFAMLRSWHEEAKTVDIWKNLRIIVVHSTEDYGRLDINHRLM